MAALWHMAAALHRTHDMVAVSMTAWTIAAMKTAARSVPASPCSMRCLGGGK